VIFSGDGRKKRKKTKKGMAEKWEAEKWGGKDRRRSPGALRPTSLSPAFASVQPTNPSPEHQR